MRGALTGFVVATACLLALGQSAAAEDDRPLRARLREALSDMHRWVGSEENGLRWHRYLRTEALAAELAGQSAPDPAAVDDILRRYESNEPGLDQPKFRLIRDLLRRWRENNASPELADLPAAAAEAKTQFDPVTAEELTAARKSAAEALMRLDAYLAPLGQNGQDWAEHLRLAALRTLLASDHPDAAQLEAIRKRFDVTYPGLSLAPFSDVKAALDTYASLVTLSREENAEQQFGQRIDQLVEHLAAIATDPNLDRRHLVGVATGWLERRGQASGLVRGIRRHYGHPNLYVRASEGLVGAGIEGPVEETEPVRDVILGTSIRGSGTTVGRTRVEFVPNERRAAIDVLLEGTNSSRTVGVNGPATIWNRGTTRLAGRKRILIDEEGLRTLDATSAAITRTKTTGLSTDFGPVLACLADRIAWKKVGQMKGQGERIGSRLAEGRIIARMNRQAQEMLAESNAAFWQKLRRPLVEQGQFPSLLRFRTTDEGLYVMARQATDWQLAATGEPPQLLNNPDLALRMHESTLNNFFAGMFSGRRLEQEEVKQQLIETLGELPEKLRDDEEKEPWSITFADYQPIVVRFKDDGFTVDVHGKAYTSGDRQFQGMNVSAEYKLGEDQNGLKAVRQGELVIFPPGYVPGSRPLSVREQTLRRIVQRRLGKLLAPEIAGEAPLKLPGKWEAAGPLKPVQWGAANGWLTLAWDRISKLPAAPDGSATALLDVETSK
ncbi:MAG: hypothetical protein KF708_09950 [Pirellulales bacterium]|nr:hypothetical protein [Pirellulales bacterium]